jgi:hypothetical protein
MFALEHCNRNPVGATQCALILMRYLMNTAQGRNDGQDIWDSWRISGCSSVTFHWMSASFAYLEQRLHDSIYTNLNLHIYLNSLSSTVLTLTCLTFSKLIIICISETNDTTFIPEFIYSLWLACMFHVKEVQDFTVRYPDLFFFLIFLFMKILGKWLWQFLEFFWFIIISV